MRFNKTNHSSFQNNKFHLGKFFLKPQKLHLFQSCVYYYRCIHEHKYIGQNHIRIFHHNLLIYLLKIPIWKINKITAR